MYLSKNGYFATGDYVFFSGVPWLGSAPMADTYLVAEAYDLGDAATVKAIRSAVESIKIGESAPSAGSVLGGFVFVDSPDSDEKKTKRTVADWFTDESGGSSRSTSS